VIGVEPTGANALYLSLKGADKAVLGKAVVWAGVLGVGGWGLGVGGWGLGVWGWELGMSFCTFVAGCTVRIILCNNVGSRAMPTGMYRPTLSGVGG
jgi:hypothetical protein